MNKLFQIIFLLLPLCSYSQNDTIAHLYAFGGNNNDNAEEIETTADGGYIVVGSTSSNSSGNTDVYLLKVDSMCNYEWSKALGGSNNDWGYSVKQTFDKGYIIALTTNSYGNGGYDACLMKRDSLGNYIWRKTYGGNDWDFAYSVVQTHDSGYVFCGETYNNTNGYSDVYVVKTNPIGDTIWTKTFGGSLIDKGNSVIETSDSNIVVAGIINTTTDSTQAYLIKLSSAGILLWDSIYGTINYDEINGVIETNDGGFVMTGASSNPSLGNDLDYYLIKTDKDGSKLWEQIFAATGEEVGYDILELANGSLFNAGYTKATGGGGKDAKLFLVTSGGFWGGQNSSFGGALDEVSKSVIFGKDGSMKMAGFSNGYGNGLNDLMIIDVDTVVPSQQFTVDTIPDLIPLTTSQLQKNDEFIVYPNPTTDVLYIKTDIMYDNFMLMDILGKEIANVYAESDKILRFENVKRGVYNLLFFNKGKLLFSKKIVIKNL